MKLLPLNLLYLNSSDLNRYFQANFEDAALIAEFSYKNYYSSFQLYHSKNSSVYILYFENEFSEKPKIYILRENLEEVMEEVSEILRTKFWCNEGGEEKRWWSFLPEWFYAKPYSATPQFNNFVQQSIDKILSETNESDLTKTEKAMINLWKNGEITCSEMSIGSSQWEHGTH